MLRPLTTTFLPTREQEFAVCQKIVAGRCFFFASDTGDTIFYRFVARTLELSVAG